MEQNVLVEVQTAVQRMLDDSPVRITFSVARSPGAVPEQKPRRFTGRMALKAFDRLTRPREAIGILDVEGSRCMIDYGAYAEIVIGQEKWGGRPGTRRGVNPSQSVTHETPLWLANVLRGACAAHEQESDSPIALETRRFEVDVDIEQAQAVTDWPIPVPAADDSEHARRRQLSVWTSPPSRLDRVKFVDKMLTLTLEFSTAGVERPIDWDTFPKFVRPES